MDTLLVSNRQMAGVYIGTMCTFEPKSVWIAVYFNHEDMRTDGQT